jgi:hypothetical protein
MTVMQTCSAILRGENEAGIEQATSDYIRWIDERDKEHEPYAPSVEAGERPDPLKCTLEDSTDQERQ